MEKPILKNEIEVKINGTTIVEDNIIEAKEYALQLKEYYSNLVFTDEQIKEAKEERASINKIIKQISDYRKNTIAEFKKPIELFETTAKQTESLLKEAADYVDTQVKAYEDKEKEEKKYQIEDTFNELIKDTGLSNLVHLGMLFDDRYLNKTYELESVKRDLDNKIKKITSDINAIKSLESEYELSLINMYLKEFNLSSVLLENNRLNELKKATEKVEEKQEEIKQEKIEKMITKKVEIEDIDPIKTYVLSIAGTLSQQKKLKEFLELNNMEFKRVNIDASEISCREIDTSKCRL